jgi:hypothetical protein
VEWEIRSVFSCTAAFCGATHSAVEHREDYALGREADEVSNEKSERSKPSDKPHRGYLKKYIRFWHFTPAGILYATGDFGRAQAVARSTAAVTFKDFQFQQITQLEVPFLLKQQHLSRHRSYYSRSGSVPYLLYIVVRGVCKFIGNHPKAPMINQPERVFRTLNKDPLNLIHRHLVIAPIIEACGLRV